MAEIGVLPAGRYYVGDLCYVLGDRWDEVCSRVINGDNCRDGVFTLEDGTQFAMMTTCYGDGQYEDNIGRRYSVDSGSIGCVLASKCDSDSYSGGQVIDFTQPFMVRVVSEGERWLAKSYKLCFGRVQVETGFCGDYDDDED